MRRVVLSVDVDANGNGIASADVHGIIMGVFRTYSGQSGSPVGTLFEQYPNAERSLLAVTSNANGYSPVMVNGVDSTNTAKDGVYVYPVVAGEVKLRVTGGTQRSAGVVWYLTVQDAPPN